MRWLSRTSSCLGPSPVSTTLMPDLRTKRDKRKSGAGAVRRIGRAACAMTSGNASAMSRPMPLSSDHVQFLDANQQPPYQDVLVQYGDAERSLALLAAERGTAVRLVTDAESPVVLEYLSTHFLGEAERPINVNTAQLGMGSAIELKGLAVIIVGGMGSLPGALVGVGDQDVAHDHPLARLEFDFERHRVLRHRVWLRRQPGGRRAQRLVFPP